MFADSFVFNAVVFLAGQVVAYLYLRTGRRQRGLALMIGAWVLIDVVLVARFAFRSTGPLYMGALIATQIWSLGELLAFVYSRVRRRMASVQALRDVEFARGFRSYLRNDLEPAIAAFRGIVRRDPWDLPVVVALATALARSGDRKLQRQARGWFRVARDLDVDSAFADVIDAELRRAREARAAAA